MPISIACPSCGVRASAPDALVGKVVKCPRCKHRFRVQPPAPDGAVSSNRLIREAAASPWTREPADFALPASEIPAGEVRPAAPGRRLWPALLGAGLAAGLPLLLLLLIWLARLNSHNSAAPDQEAARVAAPPQRQADEGNPTPFLDDARRDRVKADFKVLETAINTYYMNNEVYPQQLQALTVPDATGRAALLEQAALA
jgi:hypothetical protein